MLTSYLNFSAGSWEILEDASSFEWGALFGSYTSKYFCNDCETFFRWISSSDGVMKYRHGKIFKISHGFLFWEMLSLVSHDRHDTDLNRVANCIAGVIPQNLHYFWGTSQFSPAWVCQKTLRILLNSSRISAACLGTLTWYFWSKQNFF